MPRKKPTDTVQLKLRFPEGLRRRLVQTASANERSLNSEIVHILTSAVVDRDLMDTYRVMAETAAEAAASKVVDRLTQLLKRQEIDQKSLLGTLGPTTEEEGK